MNEGLSWPSVLILLLGYAAGELSSYLRDKRAHAREELGRNANRSNSLEAKRIEFQHATILELQETIAKLARSTGAAHHEDVMEFRKSGKWGKQQLSSGLSDGFLTHQTRVSLLAVRVRDAEARRLTNEFVSHCVNAGMTENENGAKDHLLKMTESFSKLNDHLGSVLRTLDDNEKTLAR